MSNFLQFLLLFAVVLVTVVCGDESDGLYDEKDAVIVLNEKKFEETVYGSQNAWIVEFYNRWCGHCINFAPTWKEFAIEQAGWRPVIRIAAIDCANPDNRDICRKHDMSQFPSFKLFPPNASPDELGESFLGQNKEALRSKMIDFVTTEAQYPIPESWPNMAPLRDIKDIWEEIRDEHLHVALLFEEKESYLGREIILDTVTERKLLVRRMLKSSVKKYGITKVPSLYLISQDGTFKKLAEKERRTEDYVIALKKLLSDGPGSETLDMGAGAGQGPNKSPGEPAPEKNRKSSTKDFMPGVYMTDLESTLHYALRQEVAIKNQMDAEALEALKQFLHVLTKYFPGREVVMNLLQKVYSWLRDTTPGLTGDMWLEKIESLQSSDAYLPDKVDWCGCHGSAAKYRGYPCGLWTLFHTLTVGAYNTRNQNARDLPLDVLSAVQGYMKYFFGCKFCVEHFLKMAATIMPSDQNAQGAVLWLWKAHNKANARLSGAPSEDPKHLKIQFPSKDLCSDCFQQGSDSYFEESEVFQFLIKFYGSESIMRTEDQEEKEVDSFEKVDDDAERKSKQLDWWELQQRKKDLEKIHQLRLQKRDKLQERHRDKHKALGEQDDSRLPLETKGQGSEFLPVRGAYRTGAIFGWGFSRLDIGMCVVFYVMCTLIILILYYHFIVRRKYKPCRISVF